MKKSQTLITVSVRLAIREIDLALGVVNFEQTR